jgi:hypothetical protein
MDTQQHHEKFEITNPWLLVSGFVLAAFLAVGFLLISGKVHNPVPRHLRQSVTFPVYYPDEHKLPNGYNLQSSSFKLASPGVIVFSISHGFGHLIISEENPPGGAVIGDFIKASIPLHNLVSTKFGQAQVGAFGSSPNIRTVASLSINKGPWIIITAPSDVSQDDLKAIIQSLRK